VGCSLGGPKYTVEREARDNSVCLLLEPAPPSLYRDLLVCPAPLSLYRDLLA